MIELLTIPLTTFANRFAGGGMYFGQFFDRDNPNKLWGRALYPATGVVFLAALLTHSWMVALAIALAFLVWRSPAWGRAISLGRHSGAMLREPHWFEKVLFKVSFGSPHGALLLRHFLMLLPGLFVVGFLLGHLWFYTVILAAVFAVALTIAYEAAWTLHEFRSDQPPIRNAEMLSGFLWGVVILLAL